MMDQDEVDSLQAKISHVNANYTRLSCYEEESYSEAKNMIHVLDSVQVELTASRTSECRAL